jgi:hypothetical protein
MPRAHFAQHLFGSLCLRHIPPRLCIYRSGRDKDPEKECQEERCEKGAKGGRRGGSHRKAGRAQEGIGEVRRVS